MRKLLPILIGLTALLLTALPVGAQTGGVDPPHIIEDINVGSGSSFGINAPYPFYNLGTIGDTLYFPADDGIHGIELWRGNGTAGDTAMVKDISPDAGSSSPTGLFVMNGVVYFSANDGVHGIELWRSDGTAGGTTLVKDINPGSGFGFNYGTPLPLQTIVMVSNTLYFQANDGVHGMELWRSDGTEAGTTLLKDICAGSCSSAPNYMATMSGTLYFQAYDATHGAELWRSDGTEAGTDIVKDIAPGIYSASPSYIVAMNGRLYFAAYNEMSANLLWRSDGTADGTITFEGVSGNTIASPVYLTVLNNTLYFRANNEYGTEPWRSDGTAAGTYMIKDIYTGSNGSSPYYMTLVGDTLYFRAFDETYGTELWRSDGTADGTTRVKDIYSGYTGSEPKYLIASGDALYFQANNETSGRELWKSDGTEEGTVLVMDIYSGTEGSSPENLVVVGDALYFSADDGTHGMEPWTNAVTAECVTLDTGNWGNPVIWNCGHIPGTGNHVVIAAGHTITLNQNIDLDGNLNLEGTLVPNGHTVTLTGDQPQTLTGNPLTFYNLVVNKTNKTDMVTATGELRVARQLTVVRGVLKSASDYGDIEIGPDGVLELAGDITVGGTITNDGAFVANTYAVTFDGTAPQTLTGGQVTSFYRWVIGPAARVFIDTTPTVTGVMENYGVISQTQTVNDATVNFLQIGADKYRGVDINATGKNLGQVSVAVSGNHPQCTGNAGSPAYRNRCFRVTIETAPLTATLPLTFYTTAAEDDIETGDELYLFNENTSGAWTDLNATCGAGDGDSCSRAVWALQDGDNFFLIGGTAGPTAVGLRVVNARDTLWSMGLTALAAGLLLIRRRKTA